MLSVFDAGAAERSAVAGVRDLPADVRKRIKTDVGKTIVAAMRTAAAGHARTPLQHALAGTARASWWKDIPGVAFGGTGAVTSTGARGRDVVRGAEYGSDGTRTARFLVHSPTGTPYTVTRATSAQFRPRHDGGSFVTGAADAIGPDVVDEWTAHVVAATVDALDGKG